MALILITLCWCAGIVMAAGYHTEPIVWIIPLPILIVVILQPRIRTVAVLALAFALGGLRYAIEPHTSPIATFNNWGGATIEGVVIAAPEAREDRQQIQLAAEQIYQNSRTYPISGNVLIDAPGWINVHYGDRLRATGRLIAPSRYGNFSYADYLGRSGVYSLLRNANIEIMPSDSAFAPLKILFDLRTRAADRIARALPEPEAGLLTGILLGDESRIAPSVEGAFATTGTAHIIAISGFNMVVVSGIVTGALKRLRVPRRTSIVLALAVIGVYTLFVGASGAVMRAALMSGLLIVGKHLRRRTFVPTSLALAALVLSALNPLTLWDVGFQLSFAAVLGITLFTEPLSNRFSQLLHRIFPQKAADRFAQWLTEPLIVSLSATLATLPLTMLYFGRLSWLTLIVNLLIVPVQPLVLMVGGSAVILGLIVPPIAVFFEAGVFIVLAYTIDVVRAFAALPFASSEMTIHRNTTALLFSAVVGVTLVRAARPQWAAKLWERLKKRKWLNMIGAVVIGLMILAIAYVQSLPDGRLHLWLLDMGHSNAALIRTPGGAHILIDGGRYPTRLLTLLGDRLPFYTRSIDVLVITQPDPNDYMALLEVTERYTIGAAITNGQPNGNPAYAALLDQIGRDRLTTVSAGTRIDAGDGVTLEVLNPITPPTIGDSFGESALVMRITFGNVSLLLPSDLDADAQAALLETGVNPSAQVMVIPRHGASDALDADFLRAVNPSIALLQFDPANLSRDPAPETLDMLVGIPVYRTDQDGTIHVMTDGDLLWQWGEGE